MTEHKKFNHTEELYDSQMVALSLFIPAMLFVYWNIWHYFIKPFISMFR